MTIGMTSGDTICALATAPLPAGVGIVRVSGRQARAVGEVLCPTFKGVGARVAHYGALEIGGEVVDHAVVIYFANPHSFTGEDVVEVQCHGSLVVIEKILDYLSAQEGVRRAEAGEFSRRAVENGKMDLTQAEGIADLIAAATDAQAKQAVRQMDGELGRVFAGWRLEILALLAQVEAAIDFPDEELDILADAQLAEKVEAFLGHIKAAVQTNMGERLREGFSLAVIGRPNAGKSTLTNVLTGRETAIVSDIAGTTRDVVTAALNIGGFPVQLADTAGLRAETADDIERVGIERAGAVAEAADLVVALVTAEDWAALGAPTPEVVPFLVPERTVIVVTQIDRAADVDVPEEWQGYPVLGANLLAEGCLEGVLGQLEGILQAAYMPVAQAATVTRARHRAALNDAAGHLARALKLYNVPAGEDSLAELLAQDLRDAAAAIGMITGHTGSEDVLDAVFSTFCIGK